MKARGGRGLSVGVLTVPSDPIGRASPLATYWRERLDALPGLGAAQVVDHQLPPPGADPDDLLLMAGAGRSLAATWPAQLQPDLLLCDGYAAAVAAYAIAGRRGGRVVLWLGSDALPGGRHGARVARATAHAALAVVASTHDLADRLRHLKLSSNVLLAPPLDLASLVTGS